MAKARAKGGSEREAEPWRGPWLIHFFQRHPDDDPATTIPALAFLQAHPAIGPRMRAVLTAVADTPPPAFAGGGKWEAMHGAMAGFYEVRADGPGRRHYRVFCILERDGASLGLGGPSIVLITGIAKEFRTTFSARDYEKVRQLGEEYRSRTPRSVAR